ncbi:MAG: hypothetical protein HRT90_06000 [Candidatus Margulisbacteria bacterium]|nr:hypothetical protein [Candidatus Margulisiibacteriota bacterium]
MHGDKGANLEPVVHDRLVASIEKAEASNEALKNNRVLQGTKKSLEKMKYSIQFDTPAIISEVIIKSKNTPQIITGGVRQHSICYVMDKDDLYICNAGLGRELNDSAPQKGKGKGKRINTALHLKLNSDDAKEKALQMIHQAQLENDSESGLNIIYKQLQALDGVTKVEDSIFCQMKGVLQRSGNCAWKSSQIAVRVVMMLFTIRKLEAEGNITPSLETVNRDMSKLYHQTISATHMRREAFRDYAINKLGEDPDYNPENDKDVFPPTTRKDLEYTTKKAKLLKMMKEVLAEERAPLEEKSAT